MGKFGDSLHHELPRQLSGQEFYGCLDVTYSMMLMMFEHFARINIKLQQENCRYASASPLQGLSPLEACFRFRPADGYGGV